MNILDVITELGIDHREGGNHHHVTVGRVGLDCPWCGVVGGFHLGITLDGRRASCWQCGPRNVAEALVMTSKRPWGEVKRLLSGLPRDVLPLPEGKPQGTLRMPKGVGDLLKVHRNYLRERCFDPDELAAVWGVGGIGLAARHAWTLFIPITLRGEVVSWTTRQLHDDGHRYRNAGTTEESYPAKSLLAGEEMCGHAVAVCEGFFDAARIGPGAVWTGGVMVGREQKMRMARFPRRVVCFDSDAAGQSRARELCNELSVFAGETVNVVLDAPDPATAPPNEVKRIRREFLR